MRSQFHDYILQDIPFDFNYGMCSCQGVGGILELAPGYLPAVYDKVRKAGGICIADEVQSGFARTGSHFWGFEGHGVVPDIVTMAKVDSPCSFLFILFVVSVEISQNSSTFRLQLLDNDTEIKLHD